MLRFDTTQQPLGLIGFEEAYGFEIAEDQLVTLSTGNTAEMLAALARGTDDVNFSLTYGTDGQLNELDLVVLADSKDVPPVYEPTPIFQSKARDKMNLSGSRSRRSMFVRTS